MTTSDLTFFFSAARNGDIFTLKKCINDGIDIHSYNDLALRLAVKANQQKSIIFLLTHGANINAVYDDALRQFSLEGNFELVKALLDTNTCSQDAKVYAMFNAIFNRNEDIVNLLLQNGVLPTANNNAVLNVVKLCKDEKIIALFENYEK